MSTASCPACGAGLDESAARCLECGERVRTRKRGELAGVRVDHDRLDRAIGHLDTQGAPGGWGSTSVRPRPRSQDDTPSEESDGRRPSPRPPPRAELDELPDAAPEEQPRRTPSYAPPRPTAEALSLAAESEAPAPTPARSVAPPPATDEAAPMPTSPSPVPERPEPPSGGRPAEPRPAVTHARPPVLASEALLRDIAPAKPAPRALRYASAAIGTVGAAMVTLLASTDGVGLLFTVAFAALVLLALTPMPYAARAASVATVAGSGVILVLATHPMGPAQRASLLLILPVTLLATGLYFRAFHRASALARVLVLLGIFSGVVFLATSGALRHLTMTDVAWQSWAPRLIGVPFGMLLMLSLLVFMDSRTTAGCAIWATSVLIFHALYTYLYLLRSLWPKTAASPDLSLLPMSAVVAELCAPMLTALLALATAQVLASSLARRVRAGTPRGALGSVQRPT